MAGSLRSIALSALILGSLLGAAGEARADEEEDALDQVLEGFDEEEPATESDVERSVVDRFWDLDGELGIGTSYTWDADSAPPGQPDYSGLVRLQVQLALQLDLQLPADWRARVAGRGFRDYAYVIEGRDEFNDRVLNRYQSELEFQEIWLQGSVLPSLDLKFGRQIVNWGRSDNLRVLDVLNPVDRREPGLVDIEDLRLPVTMTRLDYYQGPWQLTGIAVHETRFDIAPVLGAEFLPQLPGLQVIPEKTPGNGGRNTEWAASLVGIFSGWDMSLHWARIYEDQAHLEGPFPTPMQAVHSRVSFYGASAQLASGDFLWKTEIAYLTGLQFFEPSSRDHSRFDVLGGVEYSGFDDASIALELVNRHLTGWESVLESPLNRQRRNRVETSLRYSRDFLNQTLHLFLVALVFGAHAEDGAIFRAELSYDVRDAFSVTGGVVFYNRGDFYPLDTWQDNDRLFLNAQYSF